MEIDTVLRTLNLILAGVGIQCSWESGYGYLYRKGKKISGIELMAAGPCTVITYCTASFTRYDEDIREYGLVMYIKHKIEQIFECVPFFHPEYPDEREQAWMKITYTFSKALRSGIQKSVD